MRGFSTVRPHGEIAKGFAEAAVKAELGESTSAIASVDFKAIREELEVSFRKSVFFWQYQVQRRPG